MKLLFLFMASLILLLYAPYFFAILRGKSRSFEFYIAKEMSSQENVFFNKPGFILILTLVALAIEILYFLGAWYAVDLQLFRWFTLAFAGLEAFHAARTLRFLGLYLKGKAALEKLFVWPLERMVAAAFYIHAVLGVLLLIWP